MSPALFSQLPPPRESINAQSPPNPRAPTTHHTSATSATSACGAPQDGDRGQVSPAVTALECPSTGTAPAVTPVQGRERRRKDLGEGWVMGCPQRWLSQCSWDPGRGHSCPVAVLSPGPWAVLATGSPVPLSMGSPVPCPTWGLSCLLGLFCPLSPWPSVSLSPDCSFLSPGSQFPLQGSGIHLPSPLPCHCPSCPGLQS